MKQKVLILIGIAVFALFASSGAAAFGPRAIVRGKIVKMIYTLTVDGKVADSNKGAEPISYTHGEGQMIPGLEKQLEGKKKGDKLNVTVQPEEGYGQYDPKAMIEIPKEQAPKEGLAVGAVVAGMSADGKPVRATVAEIKQDTVVLNLNHPLAGKVLQFDVEVVDVS